MLNMLCHCSYRGPNSVKKSSFVLVQHTLLRSFELEMHCSCDNETNKSWETN